MTVENQILQQQISSRAELSSGSGSIGSGDTSDFKDSESETGAADVLERSLSSGILGMDTKQRENVQAAKTIQSYQSFGSTVEETKNGNIPPEKSTVPPL
jgi:hypothetical protein